jgi:glucokinase
MKDTLIGIEIGGTKLQVVLGEDPQTIIKRYRYTVDKANGAAGVRNQIEDGVKKLIADYSVSGLGLGFGGPFDIQTGKVSCSHQIEGWNDFEIRSWLENLAHCPVTIDNDANTASLGEALYGAGKGANPSFYITLGSGVGGGLVVDGNIYHGATPGESEIGHVRLDKNGKIVESSCSGWAVDRKIRALKETNPDSTLSQLLTDNSQGGEAKFLSAALEQNDPTAIRILEETADDLAFGLSHVVNLFHPAIIVLGGGLSLLGEPLRKAVEKAIPPYLMDSFAPGPEIALTTLGEDPVIVGALELARRKGLTEN